MEARGIGRDDSQGVRGVCRVNGAWKLTQKPISPIPPREVVGKRIADDRLEEGCGGTRDFKATCSPHIPAQDEGGPEGGIASRWKVTGWFDATALRQLVRLLVDPALLGQLRSALLTSPGLLRTVNCACRSASNLGIFLNQWSKSVEDGTRTNRGSR